MIRNILFTLVSLMVFVSAPRITFAEPVAKAEFGTDLQEISPVPFPAMKGIVFNDINSNGLQERGEKGLAGVAVSDGFTVVTTDKKGCYNITPHPKARFITVYTPDGYRNTNRFFTDIRGFVARIYANSEVQSPGNGKLSCSNSSNNSIDFGLAQCRVYGKFAQMSDIEDRIYASWIDRLKEYASIHDQDFIAITGDICYESGLRFFSRAITNENMGRRIVYTIGNHDLIKGNKDYLGNEYGEKIFEDCFGPAWYAFNAAGVHYIVTPMLIGDAIPSYSAEQIKEWIQQDLKTIPEGTPIIMFNHDASASLIPENANVRAFVYGHHHIDHRSVRNISNGSEPEESVANSVIFYCTMSPSKGSNDHSASALREFTLKVKSGTNKIKTAYNTLEISTRMHYAPISNHIVAHQAGGKIRAVIYDAASEPLKAEAILPGDKRIEMTQVNDMMWEAEVDGCGTAGQYKVTAEFSDGERIIARQVQEPGLKWMTTLPCKTYFSSPIVQDGHIYIAGIDNENSATCAVFSIDASTGAIEWSRRVNNSVKGDLALLNGVLYAGDVDHVIYAINAADGSLKWQKRVRGDGYPSFCEGVHAAGGLVYMGTGSALCALDASTGNTVWTNSHKHASITNVCTNRTADGALLTNGYWVGRFCYDAATGEFLWEKKDYNNKYSSSTPAVVDTTFIYTGYGAIMQVAARSGEILKQGDFPRLIFNTRSEPLVIDNHIYVGTSNNGFIGVNMEDMKQQWNFQCTPAIIYTSPYTQHQEKTVESSPVAWKGNVIFGANDGYLYCLNREKGQFVWSINTGLPILCKPVVQDDILYFTDFGGNIYCYNLPEIQ